MLDRHKVETILSRRFPGASHEQLAAAANAIMGLQDEWVEVLHPDRPSGYHSADDCRSVCYLVTDAEDGTEFRLLKRSPQLGRHESYSHQSPETEAGQSGHRSA